MILTIKPFLSLILLQWLMIQNFYPVWLSYQNNYCIKIATKTKNISKTHFHQFNQSYQLIQFCFR